MDCAGVGAASTIDAVQTGPPEYMRMSPNALRNDAPGIPPRLHRLLESTSQRLRNLAKLDPKVEPFTGSGTACEYVEEICCDLQKRGCDGAAEELRRRGAAVLEAAGIIILPSICKGDPGEIADWSDRFGLTPILDSDALHGHVMAFVGALVLMAEYVDGICEDLKQSGGQGGEREPDRSKVRAAMVWLREHVIGEVIAGLLIILIVAIAILKWPWIKEFLG